MATRRPLVLASGVVSELFPGDTVFGAQAGVLTAGSGLVGGGDLSTNQRVDVSLATAPSGIIFVGNQLGLDGVAQRTADAALASGNAALAKTVIQTAINLSGGLSGSVPYQSSPNTTTFLNPGTSGQVLTTQGSNQNPIWATPAGGKVLQVVQRTTSSSSSSTFDQWNLTQLSGVITPSSSSSRILILATTAGTNVQNTYIGSFTLFRGATNLGDATYGFWNRLGNTYDASDYTPATITYVDSPSTTSQINYTFQFRSNTNGVVEANVSSNSPNLSTIQLLEVGA
jgi:hypothetical protein